jgi:hypothetical protein
MKEAFSVRHVAESSPEVAAEQAAVHKREAWRHEDVFGQSLLKAIHDREAAQGNPRALRLAEGELTYQLGREREFLKKMTAPDAYHQEQRANLILFFVEFIENLDPDGFFNFSAISDEDLMRTYLKHEAWMKEFRACDLEPAREKIFIRFQEFINKFSLKNLSLARARELISKVPIFIQDPILQVNYRHPGFNKAGVINLVPDKYDYVDLLHTLHHEMTHLVAGTEWALFAGPDEQSVVPRKNGLSYVSRDQESSLHRNFKWLNEAVTERIAMWLSGQDDSDCYKKERAELQKMIDAGVEESLFYEAYFESTDRSGVEGKAAGAPAMRALLKAIVERFGPGYLKKIEQLFKEI